MSKLTNSRQRGPHRITGKISLTAATEKDGEGVEVLSSQDIPVGSCYPRARRKTPRAISLARPGLESTKRATKPLKRQRTNRQGNGGQPSPLEQAGRCAARAAASSSARSLRREPIPIDPGSGTNPGIAASRDEEAPVYRFQSL